MVEVGCCFNVSDWGLLIVALALITGNCVMKIHRKLNLRKTALSVTIFTIPVSKTDRLCGLVVSVEDYKHRGPGFYSRALLKIFLRELGLELGPLASWSDKLSSHLNKEVTVRFGKLKMQLWDSMCWTHVNPVPSGAVEKDCQRRLLSRPKVRQSL
jgi:hypothetical protein